jgi:hypothetical protein
MAAGRAQLKGIKAALVAKDYASALDQAEVRDGDAVA